MPFSGPIDDPSADIWSTIGGLLKNAFIEPLRRGLEDKVGISQSGSAKQEEG